MFSIQHIENCLPNTQYAVGTLFFGNNFQLSTFNFQLIKEGTKTYNGNLVFDVNGDLEYVLFPEGRILHDAGSFTFEYHLRDHLGSPRVAFVPNGNTATVTQETAYYPGGAPIAALSYFNPSLSTNRYFREGKEYISDFLWNKYDYGWRAFCSWSWRSLQIDPMAEKFPWLSPYSLFLNNPLRVIDPTGMLADWFENENTGEIMNVKGQSEVPEDKKEEEWINIGKDDMFGQENVPEGEDGTVTQMNAEQSEQFMNEQGYSKVVSSETQVVSETSRTFPEASKIKVISEGKNIQSTTRKWTYVPTAHTERRGSYSYQPLHRKLSYPNGYSEVGEHKTTYTYSIPKKRNWFNKMLFNIRHPQE
jgi:hypothetical protein